MAKRVPVQSRWGVDGCVVVARLWRKEARKEAVARRGATFLAEHAQHEQAPPIAVDVGPPPARGLDVGEDERDFGPSPPPPPPTDTKPSKKRAKSEDGSEKKKKKKKKKRASADPDADTQL